MSDTAVEEKTSSPSFDEKATYKELSDIYEESKRYRERYVEPRWKDTVSLVVPKYGVFGTKSNAIWPDQRYDSIGTECSALVADGMFGNLCPSNALWFRYQYQRKELNEDKTAALLLESMTDYMVQVFNRSTYYDVGPEYLQIGNSIATATMDVREEKESQSIVCTIEHPRAVYCRVNARGEVVETYTQKWFTADQVEEEYGEEALTDAMEADQHQAGSTEEHEVVECCRRNPKWKPESPLSRDWKYQEIAFIPGDSRQKLIRVTGAKELPKPVWRWSLRGNEPYGYGPVDDCMPDIRTANEMIRTMLIVKHKQSQPAEWYPAEGRTWSSDPGAKNYYRDPNRRMFKDEVQGYQWDPEAHAMIQQRVRKAMKVDHYLMLMGLEGDMTAREIVERKREGLSVIAATVGAFETMALDRIHARMLQIEADAHRLPGFRPGERIPPEIAKEGLRVEYLGPIAQQQKAVAMEQGLQSALESSVIVFKLWNQTLMKVKPQFLIDEIWNAHGAPVKALADDKEYQKALDDAAKKAQEAQQMAIQAEQAKKANPQVAPEQGSAQQRAMEVVRDQQGRVAGVRPSEVQ